MENATSSKILFATTSGILTTTFVESEHGAYILGVVGIFISILSYIYDYVHSDKIKNNTRMQTITEVIRHIIFGAFAMPAIVVEAGKYTDKVQTRLLIGVFVIWSIIYIYEAIKSRILDFIRNYKK